MANLGKCLLFYLKYPAEMERLTAKEPKVEGLPNPERVLEKINLVGAAANREAAEFLKSCVQGIEEHFKAISAPVQRINNNLEKTWDLSFKVAPKEAPDRLFRIGVCIDTDRRALIPYVWCSGGRRTENEIFHRILSRGINAAALKWGAGSVGLAEIKILIPERLEEPVACDSLVTKVQEAFASFTAQEVEAIAAIASNRGEV